MIKEKKINIKHIMDNNLHDSILNSFYLDLKNKYIEFDVLTDSGERYKIKFDRIKTLLLNHKNDFINREIILDFEVNLNENKVKMFTTSENSTEIFFERINVWEIV